MAVTCGIRYRVDIHTVDVAEFCKRFLIGITAARSGIYPDRTVRVKTLEFLVTALKHLQGITHPERFIAQKVAEQCRMIQHFRSQYRFDRVQPAAECSVALIRGSSGIEAHFHSQFICCIEKFFGAERVGKRGFDEIYPVFCRKLQIENIVHIRQTPHADREIRLAVDVKAAALTDGNFHRSRGQNGYFTFCNAGFAVCGSQLCGYIVRAGFQICGVKGETEIFSAFDRIVSFAVEGDFCGNCVVRIGESAGYTFLRKFAVNGVALQIKTQFRKNCRIRRCLPQLDLAEDEFIRAKGEYFHFGSCRFSGECITFIL